VAPERASPMTSLSLACGPPIAKKGGGGGGGGGGVGVIPLALKSFSPEAIIYLRSGLKQLDAAGAGARE